MLRVLIAGVTGWTGAPLARAVEAAPDLELVGGIARRGADYASVAEALAAVEADEVVMRALGPVCGPELLRVKRYELDRHDRQVSEWERGVYFERA